MRLLWPAAGAGLSGLAALAIGPALASPSPPAPEASGARAPAPNEREPLATAAAGLPPRPAGAGAEADGGHDPDVDALYGTLCLPCHGASGEGDGPGAAWLWPPPRDFAEGRFKWRSTPTGAPPTREDVELSIREGMPGTSMHGFGGILSEAEIRALSDRVLALAAAGEEGLEDGLAATDREAERAGAAEDADSSLREAELAAAAASDSDEAVSIPEPPADLDALAGRGEEVYEELGCDQCHGEDGRGDGPSADELRDDKGRPSIAFDLTEEPLRRPRPEGEPAAVSVYRTLATGLSGTPMPAYADAASEEDLWAVSAYIAEIRYRGEPDFKTATTVPDPARERDRDRGIVESARWPGGGEPGDEIPFGDAIEAQGEPPESAAPAQASLRANQCARCHKKQVREWRGSIHAFAGSPGLIGQLLQMEREGDYASIEGCQDCHNPLAEAKPALRGGLGASSVGADYEENPSFDEALREEGVNCATCHVRDWTRHGPPGGSELGLREQPGYPREELAIYGRSDFCLPCHQQTPRNSALSARPLLNTYREWLEGPYMPRGVQCQHCHMPNREHTFKGIHDEDTFRQAVRLDLLAQRSEAQESVNVRARLWNVGAGHFLPTTPTPAAWIEIRLLDGEGEPVAGAHGEKRIGRHLDPAGGMDEVADTRIPPGEHAELAAGWRRGRVDEARYAEVVVRVEPQEFYERFYRARLQNPELTAEERGLFEEALAFTQDAQYTAIRRRVRVEE